MPLVIGTDSYITILEADAYIEKYFLSTDVQRTAWEALSDGDKEILLMNATAAIDSVKYTGVYKVEDQILEFPRCFSQKSYFRGELYNLETKTYGSYYCQVDVPEDVKKAQSFEALENGSPGSDSEDFAVFNGNVKSYSVPGLSESFKTAVSGSVGELKTSIKSKKAQRLLARYSGGGFHVV